MPKRRQIAVVSSDTIVGGRIRTTAFVIVHLHMEVVKVRKTRDPGSGRTRVRYVGGLPRPARNPVINLGYTIAAIKRIVGIEP